MNQPLNDVQWVPRETLTANTYNPNHVATAELALLKQSILEDGWTQPIVARTDGEIVDGYHRWLTSADPEIAKMTNGLIPVVRLNPNDPAHQMASTVRHNRARGIHGIDPMVNIVRELIEKAGWTHETFEERLGMEPEEVNRLASEETMASKTGQAEFGKGWKVT